MVFVALGYVFSVFAGFSDSAIAGMLFLLLGVGPRLIRLILARVDDGVLHRHRTDLAGHPPPPGPS